LNERADKLAVNGYKNPAQERQEEPDERLSYSDEGYQPPIFDEEPWDRLRTTKHAELLTFIHRTLKPDDLLIEQYWHAQNELFHRKLEDMIEANVISSEATEIENLWR
jgi:hypothetical protein